MQALKLPLSNLEIVDNTDESSTSITYHIWQQKIVKATWKEPPQIIYISELNYLLGQPIAQDKTVKYLYGLAPSARELILVKAVVEFLRFNPSISLKVGVPVNL